MCYSFESSITAWILAFILSLIMLSYPEIYGNWIPLFILTFSQIQILEAIIWSNPDRNNDTTHLLMFVLLLQPLVNCFLGYRTTKNSFLLYSSFFYGIMIIYYLISSKNDKFKSIIGPDGHLVWTRYNNGKQVNLFGNEFISLAYFMGLFFPFLFMDSDLKYIPLFTGAITLFITMKNNPCEIPSTWCHIVIIMAVVMILSPLFINNVAP